MKNKLIRKMHIILVFSLLAVAAGVYLIVFLMSYSDTMTKLREQSVGVKEYILYSLELKDFSYINLPGESGDVAREEAQEKLNLLLYVGNFKHLYIATLDESGNVVTTWKNQNPDGTYTPYVPTGAPYSDLRRSFNEGVAITGRWIYSTDYGRVYTIFWPILDMRATVLAVVGIEFNVESTYYSLIRMAVFSFALSALLIVVISAISYLSMSKASIPIYKKMANLDLLTGLQNRLAYEQQLVSCESLVSEGTDITIVIFDIINLRIINETMGHNRGDNCIINTTKIISELVGSLGDLYRIGGDEFAAIMVGSLQKNTDKLLDALGKEKRFVLNKIPFNCAFGAATFDSDVDKSINDLVKRAEEEMRNNKKQR